VRSVAENLEISNKQVAAFSNTLAEIAVAQTKKNGVFVMPGLGRQKKVQRKARTGRTPQTGEAIKITAQTTARFYMAKAAKDAIASPK
jgi:DNA-binding protein HU-beta